MIATIPCVRIARWLAGQGNISTPNTGFSFSGQTRPATPKIKLSCTMMQKIKLSIGTRSAGENHFSKNGVVMETESYQSNQTQKGPNPLCSRAVRRKEVRQFWLRSLLAEPSTDNAN